MCQPLDKPHISFLRPAVNFTSLLFDDCTHRWDHQQPNVCPQNLSNSLTLVCQHVSIVVSYDVSRMKPWKIHNIASGRKRMYRATNQPTIPFQPTNGDDDGCLRFAILHAFPRFKSVHWEIFFSPFSVLVRSIWSIKINSTTPTIW